MRHRDAALRGVIFGLAGQSATRGGAGVLRSRGLPVSAASDIGLEGVAGLLAREVAPRSRRLAAAAAARRLTKTGKLGILYYMKSLNVRHIQHRLAAVLAEVEGGEEIEIVRRGRPVARIVPLRVVAQPADWSHAAGRLREAYPEPVGGIAAADLIADGRGER